MSGYIIAHLTKNKKTYTIIVKMAGEIKMGKEVRIIKPTSEGISSGSLRVAAYCRVSTDSDDQVNSFITQVKYYNDFIRISKNMTLVDIYADEGITGTSVSKRDEFNRMMRDSKLGKIDRIFVKSVSRFARNSLECIENIRLLKSYGTSVLFENDGIDTKNMNSEMILYIKSAFAQSEAISASKRVATAVRMRMENGTFYTYTAPFGYKAVNRTLVPVEEEAIIVRKIFDYYLHGKGLSKIAMELNKEDAVGSPWCKEGIRYILLNEKYIGDSLFQKTYTSNVFPFKRNDNNGEVDQYYVTNSHKGIVDREIFDKVKLMFEKNKEKRSNQTKAKKYELTGKVFCGDCGRTFKRSVCNKNATWICSKNGNGGQQCKSYPMPEEIIKNTFVTLYNKLQQNIDLLIKNPLNMLLDIKKRITSASYVITEIDDEIAELADQNNMYAQFHNQSIIDDVTYFEQTEGIKKRLNTLRSRRAKLLREDEEEHCIDKIRELKNLLEKSPKAILWYDNDLFQKIVNRVYINSKKEIEFELLCGFRFKEKIIWN